MKKNVFSCILSAVVLLGISSIASAQTVIPVNDLSSPKTSCTKEETTNYTYYLPNDGHYTHPADDFYVRDGSVDVLILKQGSYVDIYRGKKNDEVLTNCNTWRRMSNIVKNGDKVVAFQVPNSDKCGFNIPNYTKTEDTAENIDAQIHFSIGYGKIWEKGKKQDGYNWTNPQALFYKYRGEKNYHCYPNGNSVSDAATCPSESVNYKVMDPHVGECQNYVLFRCGDGLINGRKGGKTITGYDNEPGYTYEEECDPNHPDWKNGKDGQTCNPRTCKIEYAPVCSSEYNNQKIYTDDSTPYLKGLDSENLCNIGKLTENTFKRNKTLSQFTWGCSNGTQSTSSNECKFEQYRCGDGKWNGWGDSKNLINEKSDELYEVCDPTAPEWKNRSDGQKCNNSCKFDKAICGEKNGTTEYNYNYPTARITVSDKLCDLGKLVEGSFSGPDENGKYKWKCVNGQTIQEVPCDAQDLRCGDGTVNGSEACDPADTRDPSVKGRGEGTRIECKPTCQTGAIPRNGPVCNSSFSGQTQYTTYSTDWLNENSGLCTQGKVIYFNSEWSTGSQRKFTWKCSNDDLDITCTAKQEWCGDGIQNGSEICDHNDTVNQKGWGDDGCSLTCDAALYSNGICGSTYNTKSKYQDIRNPWLTEDTPGLCDKGDVIYFYPHPSSPIYTWQCDNHGNVSKQCRANQEWCGDGVWQKTKEQCDASAEEGKNGLKPGETCNSSCEKINSQPICRSEYNNQSKYTDTSDPWLKENMEPSLCTRGTLVSGSLQYAGSPRIFTWSCENARATTGCTATQQRCGDGERNGSEQCDFNDPDETNWGNDGCSESCEKKIKISSGCNEVFHYTLRQDYDYVFWDIFHAYDVDRRLYGDPIVKFIEQKDYNRGEDPTFRWTNRNSEKKVPEQESIKVVESTPKYHIYDHPDYRSDDNLYIEYDLLYANRSNAPESRRDHHIECVYYQISWCGDGKIDTDWEGKREQDKAEECDPGSPETSVAPNGQICNDKCEFETVPVPVCSSKYNGKVVDDLTGGNHLCSVGTYTIDSLHFDETTNTWTWKCDNVAGVGTKCSATKKVNPTGEPKIEKTLKNKIIVNAVNQKLTWTVKVIASGGDIKDFKVRDKLPKALKYETFRIVSNEDNLVLSSEPSGPVDSGSNNIYTWDVTGTLHQGHELLMEIDTIVVKMPTSKDDYLNIACVEDDGNVDCDDAKPGSADIEKELQDKQEVTHTGQKLDWKVTVTASGGDIENFEIWDKMPVELKYLDWELDEKNTQDKITVTYDEKRSPEVLGDVNIHFWNVKGVLYSGNKITMTVKSEVKTMPASGEDILNIACVIQSGNEIDCGEDKPPVPGGKLDPLKTLIGSGEVTKTGDIVMWSLKVTAKGGNVTNFEMWDDLSNVPVLAYSGYEVIHTGSVDSIMFLGEDKVNKKVTWSVKGTLKENDYVEIKLITYAKEMPQKDYDNVLCVMPEDKPEEKDCSTGHIGGLPNLRLKKSFTDGTKTGKVVTFGDEIAYKITFGNDGSGVATITSIKDFLPQSLQYVKSAIFINGKPLISSNPSGKEIIKEVTSISGAYVDIYTGITLNPGDRGYIILTGKVTDQHTGSTENWACIYLNGEKIECDYAKYDLTGSVITGGVMCISNISSVSKNNICNGSNWTIPVSCNSTGGVANTMEILCDNVVQYSGTNISILTGNCVFGPSAGTHKVECKVNGSTKAITGSNCAGTYTVTNSCGGGSTCFIAGTKVTMADGSQKNIEDVKIGEKVLGSDGNVNTVLGYDRPILANRHLWSINGSEYFVSDEHPFKTTEGWKSFNPEMTKLEVDLDTTELKVGDILITNNGLEEIKSVDYINADYNTPLYNFKLDGDHTYYANNYLVHNKGTSGRGTTPTPYCESHPNDPICELANPHCFNVNEGNFSIEFGEYLPFYFNVYRDAKSTHTYKFVTNDDEVCQLGEVDLGSLKCRYVIRKPQVNRTTKLGSDIVYELSGIDCLSLEDVREGKYKNDTLIGQWIAEQRKSYDIDFDDYRGKYWPMINVTKSDDWTKNKNWDGTLGEYQFQIEVYKYKQCTEEGVKWKDLKPTEIFEENIGVCQSNFVLTEPYTVQKTPSGNLTASTNTLKNFKKVDGHSLNSFADYLKAIATSDYHPNEKVKEAMKNFINKYEKLSVNVKKDGKPMKKVPGKNIYFVYDDFEINGGTFDKPFTVVQKGTNKKVTIKGNIDTLNMMILTEGNIEFVGDCTQNQTVKGIFYASGNLIRTGVLHNTDLKNKVWCTRGGLNIKGVLIGNNFNNLMKQSRSHLETWFKRDGSRDGDEAQLAKKVMNGASVVIEYSSSVFTKSTMPPGAEDFTTALSIYKD